MALEQQRGISITSTVLQFEYQGHVLNLLDTPGHQDFSEDTYRTLAAADNAVMPIDAAKGLERQTRKLFEVCRLRRLPIFTFINKLHRPSLTPFELMDEIEQELGLATYAVNYPIGTGDRFQGVFERRTRKIHLFQRTAAHGRKKASDTIIDLDDSEIESLIERELYHQFRLAQEYGAETRWEPLPFSVARWVTGCWDALEKAGRLFNTVVVKDRWERPVLLFKNQWNVEQVMSHRPELELSPIGLPRAVD
jgi:peptide chain release factor 3